MNTGMDTPQHSEILTLLNRIGAETTSLRHEMDARFDRVDARLGSVEIRLDRVDTRFGEVDARFDRVERKIEGMDRRLTRKIDGLRAEVVDHTDRVHQELDLRLRDVEAVTLEARAK